MGIHGPVISTALTVLPPHGEIHVSVKRLCAPLRTRRLCGEFLRTQTHRRDAEYAKDLRAINAGQMNFQEPYARP